MEIKIPTFGSRITVPRFPVKTIEKSYKIHYPQIKLYASLLFICR